jgi:hypothetical protein
MEPKDELRARLLAHVEPDPDRLARYREEVRLMLEQHERSLRWQKWYAGGLWVFVVLLATSFLLLSGNTGAPGYFVAVMTALVMLIGAAVEMLKYFLNRNQLEMLKELKGLEIQVRELKDQIANR